MGSTGIILLRLDDCLASRSYWGLLMLVSYQTHEYIYLLACMYIYISSGFFGSSGLLVIHINSPVSYFWSAHSLFVDAQFSLPPLEFSSW
jgi:hypothetical protein